VGGIATLHQTKVFRYFLIFSDIRCGHFRYDTLSPSKVERWPPAIFESSIPQNIHPYIGKEQIMKYQNQNINADGIRDENEDAALLPSLSYDQLMPAVRRDSGSRALKLLASEQEYHLAVERNRAELTYNALNLTAQLSAVEQALIENCPAAQPRLKGIVDAFSYSQAVKIVKY